MRGLRGWSVRCSGPRGNSPRRMAQARLRMKLRLGRRPTCPPGARAANVGSSLARKVLAANVTRNCLPKSSCMRLPNWSGVVRNADCHTMIFRARRTVRKFTGKTGRFQRTHLECGGNDAALDGFRRETIQSGVAASLCHRTPKRPVPPKLFPKGKFTAEFWVRILEQKYRFQIPLHRTLRRPDLGDFGVTPTGAGT